MRKLVHQVRYTRSSFALLVANRTCAKTLSSSKIFNYITSACVNISLPANVGPGVNIDCGRCLKDVLIRSFIKGGKNASQNIFKLLK